VIDLTGVAAVDSSIANHLVQTVEASRLLGATVIVTGLSPSIAQTLVNIGVDLGKMNTVGSQRGQPDEISRPKQRRMFAPNIQKHAGQVEFDPAVAPLGKQRPWIDAGKGRERRAARGVIDRPTVVGIDQAEVPQFGSLIKVRNTGRRHAQQALRQTSERTGRCEATHQAGDFLQEVRKHGLGDQR
jgi:hypothetical protein